MEFSVEYISGLMPAIGAGLLQTLQLFALTLLIALPLGLPIAFGSISKFAPLRWLCRGYVWLFRGTPLMLQLFFFCYGLAIIGKNTGLDFLVLDRYLAAVLTFALNYSAYFAEIYRAGIVSIDSGQHEAAKSLGLSHIQTMFRIIIPQMLRRILPPLANETITLVKDTALANVIAIPELLKVAKDATNRDANIAAYVIVAGFYLLLTFGLTLIYNRLEKRFSRHERTAV